MCAARGGGAGLRESQRAPLTQERLMTLLRTSEAETNAYITSQVRMWGAPAVAAAGPDEGAWGAWGVRWPR